MVLRDGEPSDKCGPFAARHIVGYIDGAELGILLFQFFQHMGSIVGRLIVHNDDLEKWLSIGIIIILLQYRSEVLTEIGGLIAGTNDDGYGCCMLPGDGVIAYGGHAQNEEGSINTLNDKTCYKNIEQHGRKGNPLSGNEKRQR